MQTSTHADDDACSSLLLLLIQFCLLQDIANNTLYKYLHFSLSFIIYLCWNKIWCQTGISFTHHAQFTFQIPSIEINYMYLLSGGLLAYRLQNGEWPYFFIYAKIRRLAQLVNFPRRHVDKCWTNYLLIELLGLVEVKTNTVWKKLLDPSLFWFHNEFFVVNQKNYMGYFIF